MDKKSFLDKIRGNKESAVVVSDNVDSVPEHTEVAGEVDHLWMKEDLDAEKPKLEKDPRIDTGILRNRIADKIAKMNNH
ncbi:MAG: hypothetical protein AB8B92_07940 [Gammaproteobacteria bacterium]